MAIDYVQYGSMETVVTINLKSAELLDGNGSWKSYPVEKVNVNASAETIFACINKGSLMCGPKGKVQYETADGSVFTINFDCPTSSPNVCNVEVSEASPWKIKGTVPKSGINNIYYSCIITQKDYNAVIDVPVSSVDIINEPKCNLVPVETILKCINGREYLKLKDIFAIDELPLEAKLWCAKSNLFLTPQSKSSLLRSYAKELFSQQLIDDEKSKLLLSEVINFNIDLSQGEISEKKKDLLKDNLNACNDIAYERNNVKLIDIMHILLETDLSYAWSWLVSIHTERQNKTEFKMRQENLVSFIGERL